MKQIKLDITGMTCTVCALRVEKAALSAGAESADISVSANYAKVTFDESKTDETQIISAIKKAGYGAAAPSAGYKKAPFPWRLAVGALLTLSVMYLSMGHMLNLPFAPEKNDLTSALLQMLLSLAACLMFYKFFTVGFKNLIKLSPTMDSLVALGSSASFLYSAVLTVLAFFESGTLSSGLYFESAAMILTLVSFGKTLEGRAKDKTKGALTALLSYAPESANVIRDGREITLPISELVPHDLVVVRGGESIGADGTLVSGNALVDESCLTGESYGVEKNVGDAVSAATVCQSGYFTFEVSSVGENTAYGRIITLVENASASKAPIARLADRVAAVFVPCVMAISLLTFMFWALYSTAQGTFDLETSLKCAVSVLVISCPCALGLATPTAITCAVGRGAQLGIFVKNAESIERAAKIDTVVFDKTGTLTKGELSFAGVKIYSQGYLESDILILACALEKGSSHPIAKALQNIAEDYGTLPEICDFEDLSGRGVKGTINGAGYICAGQSTFKELQIALPENDGTDGYMNSYLAKDNEVIAKISFEDTLKEGASSALEALRADKKRVIMLTGDNFASAKRSAEKLGISDSDIISGVLPEGKSDAVKALSKGSAKVAMVGDGINDAPSLSEAHLSLAMASGKDAAIECADIVLSFSRVGDVNRALALFEKAYKIIKENLFWALIYNVICIPIAAGVLTPFGIMLSPMLGSLAMSCSSLFVVTNALRLSRFKYNHNFEGDSEMFGKTKEITLSVEGMMCPKCAAHVSEGLKKVKGVKKVNVALEEKSVTVICAEKVSREELIKAVNDAGYKAV